MTEPQPIDDTLLGLIAAQRLVVRLHVRRVYGVFLDRQPGT
jgi:hypothetical protein